MNPFCHLGGSFLSASGGLPLPRLNTRGLEAAKLPLEPWMREAEVEKETSETLWGFFRFVEDLGVFDVSVSGGFCGFRCSLRFLGFLRWNGCGFLCGNSWCYGN